MQDWIIKGIEPIAKRLERRACSNFQADDIAVERAEFIEQIAWSTEVVMV